MSHMWTVIAFLSAIIIYTSTARDVSDLSEMRYDLPYIHIFGRNSCGYTKRLLAKLDESNIPYQYFIMDNPSVNDYMFKLLNNAGYTSNYTDIPVVDFSHEVMIRPNANKLIQNFVKPRLSEGEFNFPVYQ